jgi:hypothetical protein
MRPLRAESIELRVNVTKKEDGVDEHPPSSFL